MAFGVGGIYIPVTLAADGFPAAAGKVTQGMNNVATAVRNASKAAGGATSAISAHQKGLMDYGLTLGVARGHLNAMSKAGVGYAQGMRLVQIAQNQTGVTGLSLTGSLMRIDRGIMALNPNLLRQAGIVFDLDGAYASWAKGAGRTVASLSLLERRQIAMNAVLGTTQVQVAKASTATAKAFSAHEKALIDYGLNLGVVRGHLGAMSKLGASYANGMRLVQIAQNQAGVTGLSLTRSLMYIDRGIATMNPKLLAQAGLTVDLKAAYGDYAKNAGRTVESLSLLERRQIAMNAVLGTTKIKAEEAAVATNYGATAFRTLAMAAAAVGLGRFVADTVRYAARIEMLGVAVESLGRVHNMTRGQIIAQTRAIENMNITTEAARIVMTRFAQYELDSTKAVQLARVAQDAAAIANLNSSETVENLIHGIVTLQPRVIRTTGIVLNFAAAQIEWARANKRTYDSLTGQEKVNIALNKVLEQGIALQGTYEAAMTAVGKRATSLTRYWDQMRLELGKNLVPVMGVVVDGLTSIMKWMEKSTPAVKAWTMGIMGAVAALTSLRVVMMLFSGMKFFSWAGLAVLGLTAVVGGIIAFIARQEAANQKIWKAVDAVSALYGELRTLNEELAAMPEGSAQRAAKVEQLIIKEAEIEAKREELRKKRADAEKTKKDIGLRWGEAPAGPMKGAYEKANADIKEVDLSLQEMRKQYLEGIIMSFNTFTANLDKALEQFQNIGDAHAKARAEILKDEEGAVEVRYETERREIDETLVLLKQQYEIEYAEAVSEETRIKIREIYNARVAEGNEKKREALTIQVALVRAIREQKDAEWEIYQLTKEGMDDKIAKLKVELDLMAKRHAEAVDAIKAERLGTGAEAMKLIRIDIDFGREWEQKASEYGEAIDAAIEDQLGKLADYQKKLFENAYGVSFDALKDRLKETDDFMRGEASKIAEITTKGISSMLSMAESYTAAVEKMIPAMGDTVESVLPKMEGAMEDFRILSQEQIDQVRKSLDDLNRSVDDAVRNLEDAKTKLEEIKGRGPEGKQRGAIQEQLRGTREAQLAEIEKQRQRLADRRITDRQRARREGRLAEREAGIEEQFVTGMTAGLAPAEAERAKTKYYRDIEEGKRGVADSERALAKAQSDIKTAQDSLAGLQEQQVESLNAIGAAIRQRYSELDGWIARSQTILDIQERINAATGGREAEAYEKGRGNLKKLQTEREAVRKGLPAPGPSGLEGVGIDMTNINQRHAQMADVLNSALGTVLGGLKTLTSTDASIIQRVSAMETVIRAVLTGGRQASIAGAK